jgi:hypothetical protein
MSTWSVTRVYFASMNSVYSPKSIPVLRSSRNKYWRIVRKPRRRQKCGTFGMRDGFLET